MKKVQIIAGVCIGGILLVTVCYLIYGQSSKSSQNIEDTRREKNTNGVTKGAIYSVIKDDDSKVTSTLTCPPCPKPPVPNSPPSHLVVESTKSAQAPQTNRDSVPTVLELETVPRAQGYLVSGTTVKMFSGDAIREFPKDSFKFSGYTSSSSGHVSTKPSPQCERWAVMTTIFEVSDAVRRQVRLRNWCLVVVADKRSPKTYNTGWMPGEGNEAVVYLTPDDQMVMKNEFTDALPWNHFGRKNVGYLYAIIHGAKVIYDFDDDNLLKFWIPGAAPPGAPSLDAAITDNEEQSIDVLEPKDHNWPTYNPYPVLGAPTLPSWPRGLPLDDIKVPNCSNTPLHNVTLKASSIAVLQSLAEYEPDVDAIYRLTMPIPFFFNRPKEDKHLMVPKGTLTPYNAQATLHFRAGFFGLFLPITVSGRVTDIWRSFIAQRLFWDVGLQIGFIARPIVVQDRNVHTNIADLAAEWDLYVKGKQLMTFLENWKGKGRTIVERTEELWIALYERQFIELQDVEIVQMWLQSLIDIGYDFPDLVDNTPSHSYYPVPSIPTKRKPKSCLTSKNLTFLTEDLHDGPRLDTPTILATLGHTTILSGIKAGRGNYPSVLQWEKIKTYKNISETIKGYTNSRDRLSEDMIKSNFEYYKNNEMIASTDVFYCSYPAAYCELWMPFNKSILYLPVHRYNLGRCTKEEWDRLDEHLYMFASMDNPKHIIGAASVYDQQYLHHYTGLDPLPLYSYTSFYTGINKEFKPTRDEILFISRMNGNKAGKLVANIKKFKIVDTYSLYHHYELSDLIQHRAIVYFPYSVMSFKLVEFYGLGIPLFMPSPRFFREVNSFGGDRATHTHGCGSNDIDKLMKPHPSSTHPYSPNTVGGEAEYYWLQFSDFYVFPHITYFDDMEELERKLEEADFHLINKRMVKEVERKWNALKQTWCEALDGVEAGRRIPQDYDKAIQELYGVTRLQVY